MVKSNQQACDLCTIISVTQCYIKQKPLGQCADKPYQLFELGHERQPLPAHLGAALGCCLFSLSLPLQTGEILATCIALRFQDDGHHVLSSGEWRWHARLISQHLHI